MEIVVFTTDLIMFDVLIRDFCVRKKTLAMKLSPAEMKTFSLPIIGKDLYKLSSKKPVNATTFLLSTRAYLEEVEKTARKFRDVDFLQSDEVNYKNLLASSSWIFNACVTLQHMLKTTFQKEIPKKNVVYIPNEEKHFDPVSGTVPDIVPDILRHLFVDTIEVTKSLRNLYDKNKVFVDHTHFLHGPFSFILETIDEAIIVNKNISLYIYDVIVFFEGDLVFFEGDHGSLQQLVNLMSLESEDSEE